MPPLESATRVRTNTGPDDRAPPCRRIASGPTARRVDGDASAVLATRALELVDDLRAYGSSLIRSFFGHFETTTDEGGAFRFDGIDVHPGFAWSPQIWATHPAAGVSTIREFAMDSSIDLVLVGAGNIDGVIAGLRGGRPTVLATRSDEPERCRLVFPDRAGRFCFEDVPVGEYVVSVDLDTEQVSSENLIVAPNQTASVRVTMASSSVCVTVLVPAGRGRDLMLEPISEGAGIGGRIRGLSMTGRSDQCSFDFVRPGDYRAWLDGKTWRTVTIASMPAEQTIDLRDFE